MPAHAPAQPDRAYLLGGSMKPPSCGLADGSRICRSVKTLLWHLSLAPSRA
jgi:hypothetical protein